MLLLQLLALVIMIVLGVALYMYLVEDKNIFSKNDCTRHMLKMRNYLHLRPSIFTDSMDNTTNIKQWQEEAATIETATEEIYKEQISSASVDDVKEL